MKKVSWVFSKAYKKFNTDRCPLLASALVHATVFSLFPLFLGLISFSLFILGSSEGIIEKILPILKQIFPIGIDEIVKNISAIKQTSIVIAIIGILGFLWGAASIFRALESTLNVIWKVKKDRPFFKKSLLTIGSAFVVFILLIASFGVTILINALGAGGVLQLMRGYNTIFSIVLSVCLFSLVYWHFPNRRVQFSAACLGALFTGICWEAAKFFFSFYITNVVDFSKIYGSLSVIFLLFLWLYYSAYIFLYGAELSYVYARRKILR